MKAELYIKRRRDGNPFKNPHRMQGILDKGADCEHVTFITDGYTYRLYDARIKVIGADGMLLEGKEALSANRYIYQEWWVVPRPEVTMK